MDLAYCSTTIEFVFNIMPVLHQRLSSLQLDGYRFTATARFGAVCYQKTQGMLFVKIDLPDNLVPLPIFQRTCVGSDDVIHVHPLSMSTSVAFSLFVIDEEPD